MRALTIISFLWLASGTFAQDTLKVLTLDIFLQHVREHHPVALVAGNEVEQAKRVIQLSKGSFDPVLFSDIDQKYYDGKTYYSTISSGIKIPTRLGFNLKASGDWNRGDYLNPQNKVPADGLSYLGVEIPVGRGLLTDDRRTQLKRASVAWQQSQVEQQLTLNELLFEAGEQFIFWQEQEAQLLLAEEGLELSSIRLEQVRVNALAGERPAIDTVEASAQYYNRLIDLEQRRLNTQNARLRIEQYLWDQGMIPLQLEASIQPEKLTVNAPVSLLQPIDNHPAIQWYDLKTADLQLERKLKIEMLKPQLNLNYNLLQTPENLAGGQLSFSDYKWGASFYVPLLLRKERASLAITRLKLSSVQWDLQQKQRELQIKQLQVRNEWNTHVAQAESSRIAASRYQQLAAAERSLFELGESSLFLINAREMSYLSAQSKYLEYVAKTRKSALKESYTMGKLGL